MRRGTKKHLASKRFGVNDDGGARMTLFCTGEGCTWQGEHSMTERAQREAHRDHRRENGEEVKGLLKLEYSERIKVIREMHDGETAPWSRSMYCKECGDEWPCTTRLVVDGSAEAVPPGVEAGTRG